MDTSLVADVLEFLRGPAGEVEHDLGMHGHLAVGVVAAVELDDEEVAVLAGHEGVVVADDHVAVPVLVPHDGLVSWAFRCQSSVGLLRSMATTRQLPSRQPM